MEIYMSGLNFIHDHVSPFGLMFLVGQLINQSNPLWATAFNVLPSFGGLAGGITGCVFFVVARACDAVASRVIFKKWHLQEHELVNFTEGQCFKKDLLSGCLTVITGAVGAAIFAGVTGAVVLPLMLSVAALAALVWLITKGIDAINVD